MSRANTPEILVYGLAPQDRSGRVRWLLHEMDVPFQDRFLNWNLRENQSAEYLRLNPLGRVPVVVIDGQVLTESAAICLSLCELFPEKKLAPVKSHGPLAQKSRGLFYQWVIFSVATMEPPFEPLWFAGPSPEEKAKAKAVFMETGARIITALEEALCDRPFLLGEEFSAADIMVGSMMVWGDGILLENSVRLRIYFESLKSRPACIRSKIFAGTPPAYTSC